MIKWGIIMADEQIITFGKGKEMKIINLTPHEINIEGQKAILSSGIARCKEIINIVDNFDGIDIIEKNFGEVYDLPAPEENTIYIVSIIVASALKGKRNDVYIPGEIIRNDIGQIIGCKNIARL